MPSNGYQKTIPRGRGADVHGSDRGSRKQLIKSVLTAVFTIILLLQFYWSFFLSLLFVAQKVTKRHSTDKISYSLLGSRIFASENIPRSSIACRQLSPQKDYAGVCKFSSVRRAKKLTHSYPRLLLRPLPVILTVLYFFESNLC